MKKSCAVFGALVIGILISTGYTNGEEDFSLYHTDHGQYSILFPSTWEKEEFKLENRLWILLAKSPIESSSDVFHENINIVTVPTEINDLSKLLNKSIDTIKQNFEQFILIDRGRGKIGPHSAVWYSYTAFVDTRTFKYIKYQILNGNNLYIFTCIALPETFDRYLPIFEHITASIAFDKPVTNHKTKSQSTQPRGDSIDAADKYGKVVGLVVGIVITVFIILRKYRSKKK